MNNKHLLYHIFEYMEACDMDLSDIVECYSYSKTKFSENPQPGEISVADAIHERIEAYKKVKVQKNGV